MPDDTTIPTGDGSVRRPYQGATQPPQSAPDDHPEPFVPADDGIREE